MCDFRFVLFCRCSFDIRRHVSTVKIYSARFMHSIFFSMCVTQSLTLLLLFFRSLCRFIGHLSREIYLALVLYLHACRRCCCCHLHCCAFVSVLIEITLGLRTLCKSNEYIFRELWLKCFICNCLSTRFPLRVKLMKRTTFIFAMGVYVL